MGRRAKSSKGNADAKRPLAGKTPTDDGAKVRDLEQRLAEALKREAEALEQQTATSEILGVISSSPTDVQPVFDAIAAAATTLCGAENAGVFLFDGTLIHFAAHHRWTAEDLEAIRQTFPRPPGPGSVTARAILTRAVAHTADISADPQYELSRLVDAGFRAVLSVPMLRDGEPIGAINVTRREPMPFTDTQITLLETFARQAVIAIHNVRLFQELEARNTDLTEALAQQTATAEILRSIAASPTDYQPVFDTIVRNAGSVCGAVDAVLWTAATGDEIVARAHHGPLPGTIGARQPVRGSVAGAAMSEARVVHVEDLTEAHDFPFGRDLARRLGWRTTLAVPLLLQGAAAGAILIRRSEVRPFTPKEIALLQTFADQAVIATENVRLFTELQEKNHALTQAHAHVTEALEQQTATSEILSVISSSPTNIQPVFDTIVKSVARLCDGMFASLHRFDGDLLHWVAQHNYTAEGLEAMRKRYPMRAGRDTASGRAVIDRSVIHIRDFESDPDPPPSSREIARAVGYRSLITVPMLREGQPVGAIAVARRDGPFSAGQIALLKTFADQAVIAIENVRLFNETKEALEQQTATAEILRVISSSPTDVQPVFDAIALSALRLCDAYDVIILRVDGDVARRVAHHGPIPPPAEPFFALTRDTVGGRTVLDGRTIHVADLQTETEEFPVGSRSARQHGSRTVLGAPLLHKGVAIGVIYLRRTEVQPFTDSQIALLQTFADQAVIAIENVRLFRELQVRNAELTDSLARQTATGEILRAIAASPADVQPVFDAIARNAVLLCGGVLGTVFRFDGELMHVGALHGYSPEGDAAVRATFPRRPDRGVIAARAVLTRSMVHVPDVADDPEFEHRTVAAAAGWRSMVVLPMLRGEDVIGTISVQRALPGLFGDQEVAVLQTFADQAVIAVENVRLFKELEARNRDLTTALDQQTATSDILKVISSSPTDVQPVFDAIAEAVLRLCGAASSLVTTFDGELLHLSAHAAISTEGKDAIRGVYPRRPSRGFASGRAILTRAIVQIPDLTLDAEYDVQVFARVSVLARVSDFRSILAVPMLRDGLPIGTINVHKAEPGPFTDKQVALLQTFADQAVIAVENVRLFKELQEKNLAITEAHAQVTEALEQQTATAEILRVISRSPTDVQPVFDTIVRSAVRLCDGLFGALYQFDGELIHRVAQHKYTPEALEASDRVYPMRPTRALGTGRVILERAVVHIPDIEVDPEYRHHELARAVGFRSVLDVPMLREGAPIGVIAVTRAEPGRFSDSEVELLKTFADQAVIAVENVRLFKELQARTGELTQSVEKLTALGEVSRAVSSTLDVETVLDTIVSRASQLAGAAGCSIYEYDEAAERFELRAMHNYDAAFVEALRAADLRKGEGLMGRAAEMREPIQIPDITQPGAYQSSVRDTLIRFGYRALLSVPLLREDQIIGSLSFNRKAPGEFPREVVDVLKTFATQSALAIQNARLFLEIGKKSEQLEVASRHKSEFLASMSHELRTPLNAILGFNELLLGQIYGEVPADMQEPLAQMQSSGKHLLRLINNVLDLAKIEAGRMELALSDYSVHDTVESVRSALRPLAADKGLELLASVPADIPLAYGDSGRITQCLMNLAGNSLKFTKSGKVEIQVEAKGDLLVFTVADTGIGIPADKIGSLFTEFKQTDATIASEYGGTGLGLSISKKFIEMHGGRIWVESEPGKGSEFSFEVPLRVGGRAQA